MLYGYYPENTVLSAYERVTRKRETDTRHRAVVTAGSSARLKAETSGRKQGKQGPVGVKKVVPV
jgi:hypothetical protein